MKPFHAHVILLGDDRRGLTTLMRRIWEDNFPTLPLRVFSEGSQLLAWAEKLGAEEHILLGIVTAEVPNIDLALNGHDQIQTLQDVHWIIMTDQDEHDDVASLTSTGHLAALMPIDCPSDFFISQAFDVLDACLRSERLPSSYIDYLLGELPDTPDQGLLLGLEQNERDVVRELLVGVERVIGRRPRMIIPAGVNLTRQNTSIAAVHLVLDGQVILRRETERGELIFHHATSGLLIGLVSLTRNEEAFFTSTTTTPARVVRLTNEQLRRVLAEDPSLASTLAVLAIQSLSRRLIRAEDLHMENAVLADELEEERQTLEDALEDLKRTRAELVERTRFAMLGELSAGIAHELNNPVTALLRAAEHLDTDLNELLSSSPQLKPAHQALQRARAAQGRSTAEERELIRAMNDALGDRHLARRLVSAGIEDPGEAQDLLKRGEAEVTLVEQGARLGSALRSVLAAGERVIELTNSLKGYARPDAAQMQPCDVHAGLQDTLRLTKHRLHGIDIELDFTDLPPVTAYAAKLQQVWTNLLVNAAEAIGDEQEDTKARGTLPARGSVTPQIQIRTSVDEHSIRVTISDNGPGIPAEVQKRMFEPHFTTKAGRVRFGLGMGMSISRSIIDDLGGHIEVVSQPGSTQITVVLPIEGSQLQEDAS